MFVRNNYEAGYVNGTLGTVIDFDKKENPVVKTASNTITVQSANWTIADERNRIIAQLIQLPLRLAWAITVHKSQGMTLDAAEIDLSKSFVEGMGYVALSRVRALKNLKLLGVNDLALKVNSEVRQVDKQLIELSATASAELAKLNWLQRWLKKRTFIH